MASRAGHSTGAVDKLCDKVETSVPIDKKSPGCSLDYPDQSRDINQSVQGTSESGGGKFKVENMGRDKDVALKRLIFGIHYIRNKTMSGICFPYL